jgi:hypothetical protein
MKKQQQQFDMSQREIEQEEKKKLNAIIAEKEAWEKWDNSTPRVMQKKTVKELEEMEKDLDREFAASQQVQPQQPQTKPKEQRRRSPLANLSLEDMMA